MKTILLPFYDDDAAEAALDVSQRLGARFGSYVEGLFVMRPPQIIDGEGIVLADSYLTQLKEEGRRLGDRAKVRFDDCIARRGLTTGSLTEPAGGMVIGWREMEGLEGQVVGDHGRVFDLVVIGREFGHPWVDWHVMAEAALFESGRPIVIAPAEPGDILGENVVIAWNQSTETARTVALGMPLLAGARAITVVGVRGVGCPRSERGSALRASPAQRHLRRRAHHRVRRPVPGRSDPRRMRRARCGPPGEGRVYPEPAQAAHIRRRDAPHHDERADPDHPRALSASVPVVTGHRAQESRTSSRIERRMHPDCAGPVAARPAPARDGGNEPERVRGTDTGSARMPPVANAGAGASRGPDAATARCAA